MAAKIKLKKSSVSSNAPGTGDLDYGELAINYADGRLYYKNSSNVIKNFIDSDLLQATLSGVGGTGTVTSVAATVPTGFTVAGSPITSSGTLAVSYAAGYQGYTTTEASKLAGIEAGATGDQTASEILTAIKTVDGAASGLDADLLDGQHGSYYAPLASPALTGTPTAPTAAAGTNTTQIATTAFVGTAVSNLVASAPSTLDTLNELAAALGDDPNFATTVTNSIATKLPLAGGTMTGSITFAAGQLFDGRDVSADGSKLDGIEAGATADQTASEILTAIKTVDGSGSGLDADLLDGVQGSNYLRLDTSTNQTIGSNFLVGNLAASGNEGGEIQFKASPNSTLGNPYIDVWGSTAGTQLFRFVQRDATNSTIVLTVPQVAGTLWSSGNDGSGSGLDADLLDGQHGSYYYPASNPNGYTTNVGDITGVTAGAGLSGGGTSGTVTVSHADTSTQSSVNNSGATVIQDVTLDDYGHITALGSATLTAATVGAVERANNSPYQIAVWDNRNTDTSTDLGNKAVMFEFKSNATDGLSDGGSYHSVMTIQQWNDGSGGDTNQLAFTDNGNLWLRGADIGGTWRSWKEIWSSGNDGSGSGLDADLLDGQQGSYYQPASSALTTSTTFGGDVSGTYNAIVVANDSHTHDTRYYTESEIDTKLTNGTVNKLANATSNAAGNFHMFVNDGGGNIGMRWNATTGGTNTLVENGQAYELQIDNDANNGDFLVYKGSTSTGTAGQTISWTEAFRIEGTDTNLYAYGSKMWTAGNDGSGSGLDADTVDGLQASSFLRSDTSDTQTSGSIAFGTTAIDPDSYTAYSGGFGTIADGSAWSARGLFIHGGGTGDAAAIAHNGSNLYFGIQDGTNANSMATYMQVSPTGRVTFAGGIDGFTLAQGISGSNFNITGVNQLTISDPGEGIVFTGTTNVTLYAIDDATDSIMNFSNASELRRNNNKVWDAGNDGSGSGLDADTVDGIQGNDIFGAYSSIESNLDNLTTAQTFGWGNTATGRPTSYGQGLQIVSNTNEYNGTTNWTTQLAFGTDTSSAYFRGRTNAGSWGSWHTFWHTGNDGSGSGLDADTVDGIQGSSFFRSDTSNSVDVRLAAANGRGLRFWDSNSYKIWMSGATDATWGGRLDSTSDYNMYFRMTGGTNRGFVFMNSTTPKAQIEGNGNFTATGDINSTSDARVKDNVEVIENALQKVKQIRGVTFTRTDQEDKEKRHAGVIAQEVEKVLPEVVTQTGEYKTVAYGNLTALLIEAIKQQQIQIDNQQRLIEELQEKFK